MKKSVGSILMFVVFTTVLQAQTSKGSTVIGGGLQFQIESDQDYFDFEAEVKSTYFSLLPSVGYFAANNFAVGLNAGYSSSKSEYITLGYTGITKSSTFVIGPFARYYMKTSNESFFVYGQVSALFGSGKEIDDDDIETKTNSMDIALSPGLAYFFNEHWSVELGFRGIAYNKYDPDKDADDNESSTFEIGLNSLMPSTLGFRYYFK